MKNNKKIALFGGSFDPVHTDHFNMAKACHDKLGFEEVWIIPTFLNPFKSSTKTSNEERLNLLNLIFENEDYIKIDQFEMNNQRVTTTYETVSHFKKMYPYYDFSFVIGSDNLNRLEEWNNFDELINLVNFIVFERSNNYKKEVAQKYNLPIYYFENNYLSSTKIRELEDLKLLIPKVNDYINYHLLYLDIRMKPFMDEQRYQHCLNVGEMAAKLAELNNIDPQKAKVAGTLHDITKRWSEEKQIAYLTKYEKALLGEPKPVWHSYTGAFHLKYDWLINDEEIINAVYNHTVGCEEMTTLDMIVFCADKISVERDYEDVQYYREECFKDLKTGFIKLLINQYDVAIKTHGIEAIGDKLLKTYNFYVKGDN
ncbi:nicotinate-nucleotide adenylyltransferase [Mesoplasma coleopterae]|uniref:Probable nicotinate-nucleotide adenylyltransferase n=1 Tax=Mesoplasma coleopterae TaxID=324078 RepID=A0A2K8P439_9MOLU|nr:nicotinate-nucleotide adenylyltransferase [Mesoplasma coleopterae]ATZ20900.1 nicotinic acid mononucleotide adenylyltransferase [Mesoplasma coleopterae]AVN62399.1 nicotinate (nicotinamide) nucleotide adenylyltransferase [Mesoplasma coleopterae]AVN63082.1 nicotinate (nicotinamide) nucleotide adenylyltransferase [Mesoplasma coleopterae]